MPTLTDLNTSLAATEGVTTLIDADVTFADAEGNFDGGTVTVSGLATGDVVSVQNTGTGAGEIGFNSGTGAVSFAGTQIGTLTGGSGADATITLNASATSAAVDELLQNLTFTATSDTPAASRTLSINVTDAASDDLSGLSTFTERTGASNPFDSVDVGTAAAPVFVDVDGDGDLDAFVGELDSNINFYENTGTAASATFAERTGASNPLGGVDVGEISSPAFVDIDGDGDLDAFVGDTDGTINFFENTGTAASATFTERTGASNPLGSASVGFGSAPTFVDIDGDGDLDAFVGANSGNIFFYENTGTAASATFTKRTGTANPFNDVDVGLRSRPTFIDIDGDGDLDAFVGENDGNIFFYENTGTAASATFAERTGAANPFNGVDVGAVSSPAFVDIDGDGDLDAFVGAADGTINFFQATTVNTTSVAVSVTGVDDAPTVTGLTARTVIENTASNLDLSGVTVADADTTGNITVTITATDTGAVLAAANGAGVGSGVTETAAGNNVVTLVGTAADITTYLDTATNITYTGSTDNTTADTLSIQATDGVSTPLAASTASVSITAVNDAPTATGAPATVTVTEDTASNFDLSAIDIADVDGDSLTVTIAVSAGTLAATTGGSVTVGGSDTGSLTLAGTAANINTFLNTASNIQYTGASNANGTAAATYTVNANDSTVNPQVGSGNIDISAVNDAPTATGAPATVTVTEDTASDFDLSAIDIADVDGDSLTVTVAVSGGTLAATTSGSVTVGGSGTGSLTLAGTAANINSFLNTASNIQYTGASNANGTAAATYTVNVNDSTVNPQLGSGNIDITAVNDGPSSSGFPNNLTVVEDTASNLDMSSISITDVDAGAGSFTATLTASAGTLAASSSGGVTVGGTGTGTLTLVGTVSAVDTYLNTASNVQYTGAANANGVGAATINFHGNDGGNTGTGGGTDLLFGVINLTITAVNDDPTLTGAPASISVTEDVAGSVNLSPTFGDVDSGSASITITIAASSGTLAGTSVLGVTAANPVSGTLTLTGTQSALNTYLNFTDQITYTGASNDDTSATLTITANDGGNTGTGGGGDVALGTVTVNITAVNDAPTVSLGALTDLSVTEDTVGTFDLSAVSFADAEGSNLTVTLSVDAGTFSAPADGSAVGSGVTATLVNSTTITLAGSAADIASYLDTTTNIQYTAAADAAGDNAATLTITPNDSAVDGTAATVNIDITAVNDDPALTGLPASISVTEDVAGSVNLSAVTLSDVDSGANSITLTVVASEGTLSGAASAGISVGGAGSTLTLSGAVSDLDAYLNTASNIQYTSTLNDNGAPGATLTITANDGGNTGTGGGSDVALGTVNVTITAVNDLPTASDNTVTMNEDTSRVLSVADFGFADVDTGESLQSVRIDTLTVGSGTFRLSGADVTAGQVVTEADITAGNLVYTPAANANGTGLLTFTFSVNDGTDFAASSSTFTVDVIDVAEPAPITPINTQLDNNDTLGGTTNGANLNDSLGGSGGDDTLSGGGGADTLIGGAGADFVAGGNGNDISFAGPGDLGDDTVQGNAGNDIIGGGAGNDIIVGGTLSTSVTQTNAGDSGSDTLFGGSGNDLIVGGSYNSATNTVVNGGVGTNTIWAGTGNDTVFGDDAADTIGGGSGGDLLDGGSGADTIFGGSGDDTVSSGADNDQVFSGAGSDNLDGGSGDDTLFGGGGNDTVTGGAGADEIWAGAGNDDLSGGAGADTFVFGNTSGNDTVTDFNTSEDILNLAFASTDFASLAEVTAAASTTTQNGQAGVLIDLGDSDSVFVVGISIADLTASNVSF